MADELAQVEQTTEQTTEVAPNDSEVANTQENTEGRGDLNEALRQAREEARNLKASLADPNFIYNQAKSLGLTEEEVEAQTETPKVSQPQVSVDDQVEFILSKRESLQKYPQLATDEEDQVAITALMNAKGLSPMAAADRYYAKFNKATEVAKAEGAKEKEAVITEKEKAQTVVSTSVNDSETAEYDDILRRSRNQNNPKEANKAQLELIKWKEAHRK